MRVLYLGTPECSAECLRFLVDAGIDVIGVVTQPDRPGGRRLQLREPPVKLLAMERGIRIFQPEKASEPAVIDELRRLAPDITAVFAFSEFLSDEFLRIARISTVNLHLSLLPKYRGAAPVQWALVEGETTTGVTTFHIVKEMDAGDVIYQEDIPIAMHDDTETLTNKLTQLGSRVMLGTLTDLFGGTAPRIPQDHSRATRARRLKKSDGEISWFLDARRIHNFVRGMTPWPCAHSLWNGRLVKFHSVEPVGTAAGQPGTVSSSGREMLISAANGAVRAISVQLEGKKKMTGPEFLNGHAEIIGAVLGS